MRLACLDENNSAFFPDCDVLNGFKNVGHRTSLRGGLPQAANVRNGWKADILVVTLPHV
jgi:hypothetical protein